MTMYHITEDGPKLCSAKKGNCPYFLNGDPHYSNIKEAQNSYEQKLSKQYNTFTSLKVKPQKNNNNFFSYKNDVFEFNNSNDVLKKANFNRFKNNSNKSIKNLEKFVVLENSNKNNELANRLGKRNHHNLRISNNSSLLKNVQPISNSKANEIRDSKYFSRKSSSISSIKLSSNKKFSLSSLGSLEKLNNYKEDWQNFKKR